MHAVVHTHAPFATTLACLERGIPAFHYMVAVAGGVDIRCAPYATFGTQALSDHALAALEDRRACLLAHHGMIAVGADLDAALALAVEVETLAQMYWQALQVGEPALLGARGNGSRIVEIRDLRPAARKLIGLLRRSRSGARPIQHFFAAHRNVAIHPTPPRAGNVECRKILQKTPIDSVDDNNGF